MGNHESRFPGTINHIHSEKLSDKQASRLATLANVPVAELKRKSIGELAKLVDPSWFLGTKICGQVVQTDAHGVDQPVPLATVRVYDTDVSVLAWSPPRLLHTWFWPTRYHRELLRTVTTDECGRFCVIVPRWEIDYYFHWRLERQCYLQWFRTPTVHDVLLDHGVDPAAHLGPHELEHASRALSLALVEKLRAIGPAKIGDPVAPTSALLGTRAFGPRTPPPLDARAAAALAQKVPHPQKRFGPFLRCHNVLVPEWTPIFDIPDLTFEVLQDVNGDGVQEIIYSEGLFDVRWDSGPIADLVLHASALAVTSPYCTQSVPVSTDIGIVLAGNYPLDKVGFQDTDGFSTLVNKPHGGATVAQSPFVGSFYLMGNAEQAGATHYRITHEVGGVHGYLTEGFTLFRLQGGALQQLPVGVVDNQWFPIVPRAEGWLPGGILASFGSGETDDSAHTFGLELGASSGGGIAPIVGATIASVRVFVDNTRPTIGFACDWRHPDLPMAWQSLPLGGCPVIARTLAQRVQFRVTTTISANHLRDYAIGARGCGTGASPVLVSTNAPAHWHTDPTDNGATVELIYELAAGAPAGCYTFDAVANSRAFDPKSVVAEAGWGTFEQAPIYATNDFSVSVQ